MESALQGPVSRKTFWLFKAVKEQVIMMASVHLDSDTEHAVWDT